MNHMPIWMDGSRYQLCLNPDLPQLRLFRELLRVFCLLSDTFEGALTIQGFSSKA
jgi:hypothetical protein